jgi:hypothetical protein
LSAQGCCKRYSLGQVISRDVQEAPESVELNIPRLLRAKNSPLLKGFEASIVIIVPLGSGRPFETIFHFLPSTDFLYINDSAFSIECACCADFGD